MKYYTVIFLISLSAAFSSCKKDPIQQPDNEFNKGGIFIINEGNFSSANASVTYYDPDSDSIINNVFYRANKVPLGDVAQHLSIYKNTAYITVNNSGLVYGVDKYNMKFEGMVSGLVSPRSTLIINDHKAYISDFSSKFITVFNPITYEITGNVFTGRTIEDMVINNNKIFVSNWSGYNQSVSNNMIFVIDALTDMVIDSITVGLEPQSMVVDINSNLWVLCSGGYDYLENPSLWCISTIDYQTIKKLEFEDKESSPEDLTINESGDKLYYINKDVFSLPISSMVIPSNPIIKSNNNTFYAFTTTSNSDLYVSDVKDYLHKGEIYRYNSSGNLITSFQAGLIPGCIIEIQ